MALIAHQTVTQRLCPRTGCLVLFLDPNPAILHYHYSDAAAVKRMFQFSVLLKNVQIWAFQENVDFSRTCRTGEPVEYGDA